MSALFMIPIQVYVDVCNIHYTTASLCRCLHYSWYHYRSMLFQKKLISGHVIIQEHELEKVSVIHIAGTKGKGSTSAFTESILRQHGYRTGLFTSPHMNQIRERICINGKPISEEKFCCYFWEVFKNFEDSVVRNYLLRICLITVINFTTCSNFRRVANIFCVSRLTKGRSEGFKYFTAFVSFLLSAGGIVFRFQVKGHLLKHPYNVQCRYFITSDWKPLDLLKNIACLMIHVVSFVHRTLLRSQFWLFVV